MKGRIRKYFLIQTAVIIAVMALFFQLIQNQLDLLESGSGLTAHKLSVELTTPKPFSDPIKLK